jgi:hypothetical protein
MVPEPFTLEDNCMYVDVCGGGGGRGVTRP